MPRLKQDKAYRTFVNGFITEATGLTFPENSCRDIDNCDIELKGPVRRRLGLNEEPGGFSLFGSVDPAHAVTAHPWPSPGGKSELNFIGIQVGSQFAILDWDNEAVSSQAAIQQELSVGGNVIDVTQFAYDGATTSDISRSPLQAASGLGKLWVAGAKIKPFYVEYDTAARQLNARPVGYDPVNPALANGRLAIRDFNGVPDGIAVDTQPAGLLQDHRYNLYNQGWTDTQINAYQAATGVYPSNAQQWILGKNELDDFDPNLLRKQDIGNSPAPKGRAVLDALLGSRSGIFPGVDPGPTHNEKADSSFLTVAFFAGRVWFSGDANPKRSNGVYFSKTISTPSDSGFFAQENDPTSEHFPDLLPTDGGVLYIAEAANIQKLVPFGAGLLVMASNGVWFIYGGEGGFTADNFSVEKISSTGIVGPSTVALTDQLVAFFAENSIHTIAQPESGVLPTVTDIAQAKIFSFYGTIDPAARSRAQATFDVISKKIFWSYLDKPDYTYPTLQSAYNRMLVLDTRTGAFTKYSFGSSDSPLFYNGPAFPKRRLTVPQTLEEVVVEGSGTVLTTALEPVVLFEQADSTNDFLNSIKVTTVTSAGLRICEFYDLNFRDYRTMVTIPPQSYVSYVITGDETIGDLQRHKQATFLHSFFQRTETGFQVDSVGTLLPENPSGCTVVAQWDWHNTSTGGRWSNPQRAYRYRRPYNPVDATDPFDTGEEIVYTKLKIRGKGRSLSLKYESVEQTDFQLLGYSVAFTANGE